MHDFGGPEVLSYEDIPAPEPAAGEVLIKAAPAGLRGVDWDALLPVLAQSQDLPAALATAHALLQGPPTAYARRALLAALDELGLMHDVARRVPVQRLLGEE